MSLMKVSYELGPNTARTPDGRELNMRRLNRFVGDNEGLIVFDFEKTMKLFARERNEEFDGERAIRLFQFRSWIHFQIPKKQTTSIGPVSLRPLSMSGR